jgi:hypothetical protein
MSHLDVKVLIFHEIGTYLAIKITVKRRINLMVDNTNPTSQFHPYQPQDATPQTGSNTGALSGGLNSILSKVGLNSGSLSGLGNSLNGVNMRGGIDKMRASANKNPGMVLGGLAALVIGAGMMRKRSMRGV